MAPSLIKRNGAGIGASTKLYGLIGDPVGHSLSPLLMNAAFWRCAIDAVYLALRVRRADLPGAIAGIRAWQLPGINVTVPHKLAVMALLDGCTAEARSVGAVNTLFWEGSNLLGHNTDLAGYRAMLGECHPKRALVLGCGGAAHAVIPVLVERGAITDIAARKQPDAQRLLAASKAGGVAVPWSARAEGLAGVDLVVNCTPIGQLREGESPLDATDLARLPAGAVVHDLAYRSRDTHLLSLARQRGLGTSDGKVMLVAQAAEAFALWTGQLAPSDAMEAAVRSSLS